MSKPDSYPDQQFKRPPNEAESAAIRQPRQARKLSGSDALSRLAILLARQAAADDARRQSSTANKTGFQHG